jgi:folate-binding protein YgfZ
MTAPSPLLDRHDAAGAAMLPYGPPDAPVLVPAAFEAVGAEYAAVRTGAALLDEPTRGTLLIAGPDRLSFLNSMVTQDVKALPLWRSARSFWLNRKGRIDADLRLTSLPADATSWISAPAVVADVDVHAAARAAESLSGYLIAEDATVGDATARLHRLSLHGPRSAGVLAETAGASGSPLADLPPAAACVVTIADTHVLVERDDPTGQVGFSLTMPAAAAPEVYAALARAGAAPVGWLAFNTARIEGGTPLYYVDFGPTNLPAESGLLNERVSFKKGCYLGQEIVARMHALGAPKQTLVALRVAPGPTPSASPGDERSQPGTGAEIRVAPDAASPVIGAVTSSTISPRLGSVTIAFAMVKFAHAKPDTDLYVTTPAGPVAAKVQPNLRFLP